jgi:hypothetical protein
MRRITTLAAALLITLVGMPFVGGCEREIESEKKVEVKQDGTKVTEEKKVTQDTQTGEVTRTEEKKVDKP